MPERYTAPSLADTERFGVRGIDGDSTRPRYPFRSFRSDGNAGCVRRMHAAQVPTHAHTDTTRSETWNLGCGGLSVDPTETNLNLDAAADAAARSPFPVTYVVVTFSW